MQHDSRAKSFLKLLII